jgi:hypothetical protein
MSRGGIALRPGAVRDAACSFSLDGSPVEDPRAIRERVLSLDLAAFGS